MSAAVKKCIGCGYCCDSGPCAIAIWHHGLSSLFNWKGCRFLYFDAGRYWCKKHASRKRLKLLIDSRDHCIMPNNQRRLGMEHGLRGNLPPGVG